MLQFVFLYQRMKGQMPILMDFLETVHMDEYVKLHTMMPLSRFT